MLAIRLTRMGSKKRPFYRIVVAEKRSKRDGAFVEAIGYYNPLTQPAEIRVDWERFQYWVRCGAQPTEVVRRLIRKAAPQASERES
uniref:Small ribosomal subunit protein bS16 n=1 Tax=uncultured Acidobacteriota bacterium TaxID=171953 RepID=H5SIU7_9BACT|nr:hypothetical conserved protein [uncultured Acidobacteriota bacterium]